MNKQDHPDTLLGVRSDLNPNKLLTHDHGRPIPRQWYEDADEAPTDEAIYSDALRHGLPRDPAIEARIDMSLIDPELLEFVDLQVARLWMSKVHSGGIGILSPEPKPRYFQNGTALYRVFENEYCFLNSSGEWIPSPAVCDHVTGMKGDASTEVITEAEAKIIARRRTRRKIIWK